MFRLIKLFRRRKTVSKKAADILMNRESVLEDARPTCGATLAWITRSISGEPSNLIIACTLPRGHDGNHTHVWTPGLAVERPRDRVWTPTPRPPTFPPPPHLPWRKRT